MRPLIFGAAFALLGLLTGCQSPHVFTTPDASWKSHVGQLKFSVDERTLIGEVIVAQSARGFQLEFLKGGSFRLLKISVSGDQARAEGVLARGSWRGPVEKAPRHLRHWVQLPAIFSAANSGKHKWTADSTETDWAKIALDDGAIRNIRFSALTPDQDFEFQFSR